MNNKPVKPDNRHFDFTLDYFKKVFHQENVAYEFFVLVLGLVLLLILPDIPSALVSSLLFSLLAMLSGFLFVFVALFYPKTLIKFMLRSVYLLVSIKIFSPSVEGMMHDNAGLAGSVMLAMVITWYIFRLVETENKQIENTEAQKAWRRKLKKEARSRPCLPRKKK